MTDKEKYEVEGLPRMRVPFKAHQISKLPKPSKVQTEAVKADFKKGIRCALCGAWHHPDVVHLDYVGHAALTDRLLDVDASWQWEPVAFDAQGLPAIDKDGGLWIRLTVCGVTRLGYGDAQGKTGGDAMKERIGDALRNAAMRFGAALDLWHKGELHIEEEDDKPKDKGKPAQTRAEEPPPEEPLTTMKASDYISDLDSSCENIPEIDAWMAKKADEVTKNLSAFERNKLKAYIVQLKKALAEKQEKF